MVYKIINSIIGKILLKKKKSEIRQDRYKILTFSTSIISVGIKEIMGYLPLLPVVFETPPSPFSKYSRIFVALQPFLFFSNTKKLALFTINKKHVEFWHLKVMSFHFNIQNGH